MEYLFGIHGVVLALTLARLLTFVGKQIEKRRQLTFSIPHALWSLLLLLLIVDAWWGISQHWVSSEQVTFLRMTFLLGTPICLFLMVSVLTPTVSDTEPLNVKKIFTVERVPLYLLGCFALVWESGVVVFVVNATKSIEHELRLVALVPLLISIFYSSPKIQEWLDMGLVILMLILFFLFLALV